MIVRVYPLRGESRTPSICMVCQITPRQVHSLRNVELPTENHKNHENLSRNSYDSRDSYDSRNKPDDSVIPRNRNPLAFESIQLWFNLIFYRKCYIDFVSYSPRNQCNFMHHRRRNEITKRVQ